MFTDEQVLQYLPLVKRVARTFAGIGEPIEDLEQEGFIGLLQAIERFDEEKGAFSTFAWKYIAGAIKRYLRDTAPLVRQSGKVQEDSFLMRKTVAIWLQEYHRYPTDEELAKQCNLPLQRVQKLREWNQSQQFREVDYKRDASNNRVENCITRIAMAQEIARLPLQQNKVLSLILENGFSQTDVARYLGMSDNYVSYLYYRGVSTLRKRLGVMNG